MSYDAPTLDQLKGHTKMCGAEETTSYRKFMVLPPVGSTSHPSVYLFQVKKFITRDAVVFPIDVDFERHYNDEESGDEQTKVVKRSLFVRMNQFPQKKIMTFNKHVIDFTFNVNYNDLDYLSAKEIE